jgi:bifunctional non-homologous end joining protein LigD
MAKKVSRRAKVGRTIRRANAGALPDFVPPQLTALTETAPEGGEWAHELKWDGYRMHAHIDGKNVRLLTRTGLDWTDKYPAIAGALRRLPVKNAYLDGELCALSEAGLTSFSAMQAATDARSTEGLVLVLFDLIFLDGEDLTEKPLRVRKERLEALLANAPPGLQYSEHHLGSGERLYRHACKLGIEGIVSKRLDCPYRPGDRGIWRKVKCLNREEFVVVGWTDPEGSRPHLGALLLAYYAPDGRLVYAGRAGTGMNTDQLRHLRETLESLATTKMPLDVRPPKGTRFGSGMVLSRVHWVRPEMVVEVTYLTWTDDNLLRHVVFDGVREDKPARDVVRPIPHPEMVLAEKEREVAPTSRRMARPVRSRVGSIHLIKAYWDFGWLFRRASSCYHLRAWTASARGCSSVQRLCFRLRWLSIQVKARLLARCLASSPASTSVAS